MAKLDDRTPEYWERIKQIAIGQMDSWIPALARLLGKSLQFQITFSSDPNRFSPSIRQQKASITIDVPEHFLLEFDEAVKWMIGDVPFHDSFYLARINADCDVSETIWLYWLLWILNHELAHFYPGHLTLTKSGQWAEFEALESSREAELDDPAFRRALEIDADVFATQAMFCSLARMTKLDQWKLLYHQQPQDEAKLALHDLGLIIVPLCLELGHMSPSSGPQATHPEAKNRLLGIFQAVGWDIYFRMLGRVDSSHIHAFRQGMYEGIKQTFHIKESVIHKPFPDMEIESARELLINAKVHQRRWLKLQDDWLFKTV